MPRLALNLEFFCLSLLNSWNYRSALPHLALLIFGDALWLYLVGQAPPFPAGNILPDSSRTHGSGWTPTMQCVLNPDSDTLQLGKKRQKAMLYPLCCTWYWAVMTTPQTSVFGGVCSNLRVVWPLDATWEALGSGRSRHVPR